MSARASVWSGRVGLTVLAGAGLMLEFSHASAEPVPDVLVTNVRRVFHNGAHNAFTDLDTGYRVMVFVP